MLSGVPMSIFPPGTRPLSPGSRAGLGAALVLLALVSAVVLAATGIAAAVAVIRQRQVDRIAELSRLASVAQQAVLRPLGPQVGSLAVAGRYISATAAADIRGGALPRARTP